MHPYNNLCLCIVPPIKSKDFKASYNVGSVCVLNKKQNINIANSGY